MAERSFSLEGIVQPDDPAPLTTADQLPHNPLEIRRPLGYIEHFTYIAGTKKGNIIYSVSSLRLSRSNKPHIYTTAGGFLIGEKLREIEESIKTNDHMRSFLESVRHEFIDSQIVGRRIEDIQSKIGQPTIHKPSHRPQKKAEVLPDRPYLAFGKKDEIYLGPENIRSLTGFSVAEVQAMASNGRIDTTYWSKGIVVRSMGVLSLINYLMARGMPEKAETMENHYNRIKGAYATMLLKKTR